MKTALSTTALRTVTHPDQPTKPGAMKLGFKTKKSSAGACAPENAFSQIIGQSAVLQHQLQKARQYAATGLPILINGETGTGKDLVAQGIHRASRRAGHPFVPFNCAGSTLDLFEDRLFGHVRGAFTGASHARRGLVEMADTGILFLDEINSLPLAAQAKILRFVETGEYQKLGADAICHADVRILCATNQDLPMLVHSGNFREDLFYRLNPFSIALPPLRQRAEDIPLLAAHFLECYTPLNDQPSTLPVSFTLTSAALQKLLHHAWPGNVRELQNVIQRALALSSSGFIDEQRIEFDSFSSLSFLNTQRPTLNSFINSQPPFLHNAFPPIVALTKAGGKGGPDLHSAPGEGGSTLTSQPQTNAISLPPTNGHHSRAAETLRAFKARAIQPLLCSFLQTALALHGGNITHAAKALGMNRR